VRTFKNRRSCLALFIVIALLPLQPARAADYPDRPIRLIAPFSAGGGIDVVARVISEKMSSELGQQVIIDNRPGASGVIGTEAVARAPNDGYTLLMGNVGTHAINVSLFKKLSYDPVKDFAPIALVARVPEVLVVLPSSPATSVQSLIALAKGKPGQLNYGSAGLGSPTHMAAALFTVMAGVKIEHIPYKGSAPALVDLLGGRIDLYFNNVISAMPYIRSGELKALGVTGATRLAAEPDIPTIAESGLAGYETYNWYGIFAPKNTPRPIIEKLNKSLVSALKTDAAVKALTGNGADVIVGTPEEFATFVTAEIAKYAVVVKETNVKQQE
jgi:tripartite-type tricarboxylate transporter receptor subunit TctC